MFILELPSPPAKELIGKGIDILESKDVTVFPRIGNNSKAWYECKWCNYTDICFGEHPADKNCRTCSSCSFVDGGIMHCFEHDRDIDLKMAEEEYECHKYIECL